MYKTTGSGEREIGSPPVSYKYCKDVTSTKTENGVESYAGGTYTDKDYADTEIMHVEMRDGGIRNGWDYIGRCTVAYKTPIMAFPIF